MCSSKPARWAGSLVVVGATGLVQSGTAIAQSQGDIEEVAVVSRRLEESLPQQLALSGSRVTVVTAEEIRKGGYNDLGQALQYTVPGLFLNMTNGPFSYADVSLQGGRPGDILWLVDGVRVNNRLYSGTLPLDTLPAHMIERIDVLEGGQGLFYGTQAISGVINVITREFSDKTGGEVGLGFDENDGRHANAYLRGELGANHFVLYGSYDDGEGFQPFRDQDYQPSATDRKRGYDVKSGGLKLMRDFTEGVRFSASYQHTDADIQLLYPMRVAKNVNSRDEELVSAKLDWRISESVDFYVKGYYHDWDTHYTTLFNSLVNPGSVEVDSDNLFWGFDDRGVNALLRLKLLRGYEYYVGYDMQEYGGRDEVLLIAPHREKTQAVFGQVRTDDDWSTSLHLSAGLRYNSPSDADSSTIWTGTAKIDISPNLFLRGNVGTAFKLPTAEELYAIDPFEHGDPNLKAERSRNLNLSIGGGVPVGEGSVSWEVIGFARNVTNLIDYVYDPVQDLDQISNVPGKVKVRGAQAVLTANAGNGLTARLGFTRNNSKDPDGQQLSRVPKSVVQAGLDYAQPRGRWGAGLMLNQVGNTDTVIGDTRFAYGNYSVLDLNGRYFFDDAHHHRVGVRLENAFDQEYGRPQRARRDADNSGYPAVNVGTPRTWSMNYTYSF